jgi:enoyl-CoA hydratase
MACERVNAEEALRLGLVNLFVPDQQLAERVEKLANKIAAMPSAGLRQTKPLINQMSPLRGAQWDAAASAAFETCFATPEAQANVAAFLARQRG